MKLLLVLLLLHVQLTKVTRQVQSLNIPSLNGNGNLYANHFRRAQSVATSLQCCQCHKSSSLVRKQCSTQLEMSMAASSCAYTVPTQGPKNGLHPIHKVDRIQDLLASRIRHTDRKGIQCTINGLSFRTFLRSFIISSVSWYACDLSRFFNVGWYLQGSWVAYQINNHLIVIYFISTRASVSQWLRTITSKVWISCLDMTEESFLKWCSTIPDKNR